MKRLSSILPSLALAASVGATELQVQISGTPVYDFSYNTLLTMTYDPKDFVQTASSGETNRFPVYHSSFTNSNAKTCIVVNYNNSDEIYDSASYTGVGLEFTYCNTVGTVNLTLNGGKTRISRTVTQLPEDSGTNIITALQYFNYRFTEPEVDTLVLDTNHLDTTYSINKVVTATTVDTAREGTNLKISWSRAVPYAGTGKIMSSLQLGNLAQWNYVPVSAKETNATTYSVSIPADKDMNFYRLVTP